MARRGSAVAQRYEWRRCPDCGEAVPESARPCTECAPDLTQPEHTICPCCRASVYESLFPEVEECE